MNFSLLSDDLSFCVSDLLRSECKLKNIGFFPSQESPVANGRFLLMRKDTRKLVIVKLALIKYYSKACQAKWANQKTE